MTKTKKFLKVKILLSLTFLMACVINTLLEFYREIVIITKQIPSSLYYIKLFFSLPIICLMMSYVQKALNVYSILSIVNFIIFGFIGIFFLIGSLLIPFEYKIQKGSQWALDIFCDGKMSVRSLMGLSPFLYMYSEWISTLCYILSELWSTLVVGFALYALANHACTEDEMKEIVPNFSTITAISMIISVAFIYIKDELANILPAGLHDKIDGSSLFFLILSFVTTLIYFLKSYIPLKTKEIKETINKEEDKTTSSFDLLQSKFLRNMCAAALIYAINAGFIDMSLKNSLSTGSRINNMPPKDYSQKYLVTTSLTISAVSLFYNFVIRGNRIASRIFYLSIASPIAAIFFTVLISGLSFYNLRTAPSVLRINLENWCATIGFAFSKITKYVLFDLAKEMLSMRVPVKYRYKFKSFYDGVCIKIGKSIISLYGTFLTFIEIPDIRQVSYVSFIFLIFANFLWIRSVCYLSKKYNESIEQNSEIDVDFN